MKKFGADNGMTEGFVDFPLSVDTVEVCASVMEVKKGQYKISLRSKRYADVNKVAGVLRRGRARPRRGLYAVRGRGGGSGQACLYGFPIFINIFGIKTSSPSEYGKGELLFCRLPTKRIYSPQKRGEFFGKG